jgi:hypothetical protein
MMEILSNRRLVIGVGQGDGIFSRRCRSPITYSLEPLSWPFVGLTSGRVFVLMVRRSGGLLREGATE